MRPIHSSWLVFAGALSALAALLHLAIIWGGGPWYRFFGAGEEMAVMAEAGSWYPAALTLAIALVLATWAAYAWSAAGWLLPLPWRKGVLLLVTLIYALRGLAVLPGWLLVPEQIDTFLWWSSAVCLVFALAHALGLRQAWASL
ncbi:hypothetical protein [Balneatrix alpica]|uniref:DUF3995 domain-containing protein n=1 Tax=Balneatrix alpica TaxID=75684 RepID=A0ABV5ZE78_9GAMM|nr:hypothetical protein [Balneatrix alpica]